MSIQKVLAIETSCDDTSVAVVGRDGWVHALQSASQDSVHAPFGGIVPEVAGRSHYEVLLPLIDRVVGGIGGWDQIHGIAVTNRPGLLGSLLVGVVTAKMLAQSKGLPFLGINHLEGHIWAPFLRDETYSGVPDFQVPFVSLAVSGGHTSLYLVKGLGNYEVLGTTRDDAAGEAFDKFAKMLGLGFPGGIQVDRLSHSGSRNRYSFPQGLKEEGNLDFSFSGLKSAGQRLVESLPIEEKRAQIRDLCASFQEAIVQTLLLKLSRAVEQTGVQSVSVTGGVSANSRLREVTTEWCATQGLNLAIPPLRFCTDNAAMIGFVGSQRLNQGERDSQNMGPHPVTEGLT